MRENYEGEIEIDGNKVNYEMREMETKVRDAIMGKIGAFL